MMFELKDQRFQAFNVNVDPDLIDPIILSEYLQTHVEHFITEPKKLSYPNADNSWNVSSWLQDEAALEDL